MKKLASQLGVSIGEVILSNHLLETRMLQAFVQAQSLIDDGILKIDQAQAALHYAHKTGIDFADALKEVSWLPQGKTDILQEEGRVTIFGWVGKFWSTLKKQESALN